MNVTWYLARASGITAWALLAASVLWGYVLSTRPFARRPRPAWTLAVHRFLSTLSVVFVGVHLAALVGDRFVHFGVAELLVPMASRWHPLAVAWGVAGLYLLVAIEITSLVMKRLPRRLWLSIHRLSFVLLVLATMHFVAAGTDARGNRAVQLVAVGVVVVALFGYVLRMLSPREAVTRERRGMPAVEGATAEEPLHLAGTSASE